MLSARSVRVAPLDPDTWPDLEALFGKRGAHDGCWCTYYRIPRASFMKTPARDRKALLRQAAEEGPPPGLIAYVQGEPVAWVAIAPREETPVLDASRVTASPGGLGAWAITCFFVRKDFRAKGMMALLIRKATRYAKLRGANLVEAFPRPPGELKGCSGYTGISTTFLACGFDEVATLSKLRVHVRREL